MAFLSEYAGNVSSESQTKQYIEFIWFHKISINYYAKNIADDISIKGKNYSAFVEADENKNSLFCE